MVLRFESVSDWKGSSDSSSYWQLHTGGNESSFRRPQVIKSTAGCTDYLLVADDGCMASAIQEWLDQGERLYQAALQEYHTIASQLDAMEQQLAAKQAEVNQIAAIIGKPTIDEARKMTAQIVAAPMIEERLTPMGNSNANIARALAGRFGR
jgi:hypothetical protein